ncbi:MAG: hypothetical protein OHK0046_10310 [Anaerolineae bacterium]
MQKVAIALVHGVGEQTDDTNILLERDLIEQTEALCGKDAVVFKVVFWAPVVRASAELLYKQLSESRHLNFLPIRRYLVNYLGDVLAYQIIEGERGVYDAIHSIFADTLNKLAEEAGPRAPLIIVAHSLGTIITSNYFYDLQKDQMMRVSRAVRSMMGESPLERGETLTSLYTFGSPLPIWSLGVKDFGMPMKVPAPLLRHHHPKLEGEWINFYDADDVLGYPLKSLNAAYNAEVKEDRQVNIGKWYESWNPLSHLGYWRDKDATHPVAEGIHKVWQTINL